MGRPGGDAVGTRAPGYCAASSPFDLRTGDAAQHVSGTDFSWADEALLCFHSLTFLIIYVWCYTVEIYLQLCTWNRCLERHNIIQPCCISCAFIEKKGCVDCVGFWVTIKGNLIKWLSINFRTVCSLLATWCILHMNNSRLLCRKCVFDIKIISAATPRPSFIIGLTTAKLPSSECFFSFHSAAWFVMTVVSWGKEEV